MRQKLDLQTWLASFLRGGTQWIEPKTRQSTVRPVDLLEHLTEREVELVRLLQSGLDNRKLADTLLVSQATVKWHLHNVYCKLGVRSRGAAVARASQLGLV